MDNGVQLMVQVTFISKLHNFTL